MQPPDSIFLSIEGPDGCGKSTVTSFVRDWFIHNKVPGISVRDPGGSPLGEQLRPMTIGDKDLGPTTRAALFLASRADLAERIIVPMLKRGTSVASDRWTLSTWVYQGFLANRSMEDMLKITNFMTNGLEPTLTILLTAKGSTLLSRVRERRQNEGLLIPDVYDSDDVGHYETLARVYEYAARTMIPESKLLIVPTEGMTVRETQSAVQAALETRFPAIAEYGAAARREY